LLPEKAMGEGTGIVYEKGKCGPAGVSLKHRE